MNHKIERSLILGNYIGYKHPVMLTSMIPQVQFYEYQPDLGVSVSYAD